MSVAEEARLECCAPVAGDLSVYVRAVEVKKKGKPHRLGVLCCPIFAQPVYLVRAKQQNPDMHNVPTHSCTVFVGKIAMSLWATPTVCPGRTRPTPNFVASRFYISPRSVGL